MISISNITLLSSSSIAQKNTKVPEFKSLTEIESGADLEISSAAKELSSHQESTIYDPTQQNILGTITDITKLPVEHLGPNGFILAKDVAAVKESIKNDFTSVGVYVDSSYVDAYYAAISDMNYPSGMVPPIDFPTPPSWWCGA